MANITITIPDANLAEVIDAICDENNFALNGGALTKAQFAKKVIVDMAKNAVKHRRSALLSQQKSDELTAAIEALTPPDIT
jgi:hypothetical protein